MDLSRAWLGRLEPDTSILWLVTMVLVSLALCLRRDEAGRLAFRPTLSLVWLIGPWAALAISIAAFRFGMSHPLVQYNDEASAWWWHFWFSAWIPLLGGTLALATTAFLVGVVAAARQRLASALRWFVAAGLNAFSLFAVLSNFPDC